MFSRLTINEKLALDTLRDCTNNQYVVVTLVDGDVHDVELRSRTLAFATLGLSLLFTSPYATVTGDFNDSNKACYEKMRRLFPCRIYCLWNTLS